MASIKLQTHQKPLLGDHLWIRKKGYTHHALYVGESEQGQSMVIHYAGWVEGFQRGPLCLEQLDCFSQGQTIHVQLYQSRPFTREHSVERAFQRLGENQYSAHANNCEHLCVWAIKGEQTSKQVDWFNTVLGAIHPGLEAASKGVGSMTQPKVTTIASRKQIARDIAKDLAIDWGVKSVARWAAGPAGLAAYVGYRVSKQWLKQKKY